MPHTSSVNLKSYLREKAEFITGYLSRLVVEKNTPYNVLYQAARYSLLGDGKRIRPILAMCTCEALGGSPTASIIPACALEMVHAYSMIHDDLPSMDNDDFRRGKPTLHKVYPESHAILAGDYLLTQAFGVLAAAPELSAEQKLKLVQVLAWDAGGDGMIGGQVMDIDAEGQDVDLPLLQAIHSCKTGALICASVDFGAIAANAALEQRQVLRSFAEEIGLAFQIVDDVLDVTASKVKHGKDYSSDAAKGKKTYVAFLGLEGSRQKAEELLQSALIKIRALDKDTSILENIAEMMVRRAN